MNTTVTTKQKAGLGLGFLLSLSNLPALFVPSSDENPGPPIFILIVAAALGVVGMAAAVHAWRTGSRVAPRLLAGTLVINALTALPAFFVEDVPAGLRILAAVFTLLSIASVVLIFAPSRRPVPVAG